MPPKRKLSNSGGPTSKRRANNEATPLEEANTAAMGQDLPQPLPFRSQAPIDYDLLAAAIIKQSQQPQSGTVTIAEPLQSPSNTTDQQPISHATTTGVAQSVNSSGIGALLDQVFLQYATRVLFTQPWKLLCGKSTVSTVCLCVPRSVIFLYTEIHRDARSDIDSRALFGPPSV